MAIKRSNDDRLAIVVIAACGLFDSLVEILSLGFLASDLRAEVLFSEWVDQRTEAHRIKELPR